MKPFFTIHGGEYLVGSYIEQHFRRVNVWIPSRDTGVDLLVSGCQNCRALSLQVKFSKDFLPHMGPQFQKNLRACGWWTIDRAKLRKSSANFWVFVLLGFAAHTTDFVIIPTKELWRRLRSIHHGSKKVIQSYLWVTDDKRCWETRGLKRKEQLRLADGEYRGADRDLTKWLNIWTPVAQLNR
jgi:hypothetical protein